MDITKTLPITYNARGLGGMKTEDGKTITPVLFRADALNELNDKGQQGFEKLKIGTVIDMRTETEQEHGPDILPKGNDIEFISLPMQGGAMDENVKAVMPKDPSQLNLTKEQMMGMLDRVPTIEELYIDILRQSPKQFVIFAKAVITAADSDKPGVLFHCTAGKDRTGLGAALLLSVAGVSRKDIVADYTLTEKNIKGPFAKKLISIIEAVGIPMTQKIETLVLKTPASAIEAALDYITENHGDAVGYFKDAGLSEEDIQKLQVAIVNDS
ncbi:MAG: tyrosine-protein phosphatase [Micrococcaceae bacterium]